MTRTLRSLLARLGIGDRRWIPSEPERTEHRDLVRDRLSGPSEAREADAREVDDPDPPVESESRLQGSGPADDTAPTAPRRRRKRARG